ncbi:hypothetical protein HH214_02400 [Mucilaginibacter robiniae]|uniref:Uncharacterized protein n=1 Tax=Mucilaginibacter robiniae TaxID=2728022 RepID=A0A7L5DX45_9SPHI|nr:hypothetical protein [Mucilaginibacter robiniae]QJD94808.1 hypothetical protein HH214_02400 [Mucilaginibacter robiniae]
MYACKPDVKSTEGSVKYFELKKFIKADSARLTRAQVIVTKTVQHNNSVSETKQLRIVNWGRELEPFSASDLNKPAWRQSYTIQQAADSIIYTAKYSELITHRMVIYKQDKTVKKIIISNYTKNLLYQTTEQLVYFPDSLYLIDKLQQVKFLGSNRYQIKGTIGTLK